MTSTATLTRPLQGWTAPRTLAAAGLVTSVLELVDAFHLEVPAGAIISTVLYVVGLLWMRRGGRGGVILVGVLCTLELVGNLVLFGGLSEFMHPTSAGEVLDYATFTVVDGIGAMAFVQTMRRRRLRS